MTCESCNDERANTWFVSEKGSNAGAGTCAGCEMALCDTCSGWAANKGCPDCFW